MKNALMPINIVFENNAILSIPNRDHSSAFSKCGYLTLLPSQPSSH